ncbi:MAG: hypothetical protein ACTSVU_07100 [Promethearchaeota archaeon]
MGDNKDILIIWIGQAGINIAEKFWDYAFESLGIPVPIKFDKNGNKMEPTISENSDSFVKKEFYSDFEKEEARRMFFYNLLDEKDQQSGKPRKYIPRTIFLDVDTEPIRSFAKRTSKMFPKESFIYNQSGSYSMFSRAERKGEFLKPRLLEQISSLIKMRAIQNLEGIILVHATGGGAGSGLLSSVFDVLEDRFNKVPILTFTIYPSQKLSGNVVESYNTVYTVAKLLDNADASILIDNDKIIELVHEKYEIPSPSFEDINLIISRLIFSTLMQFAMPGAMIRMDFSKIFTNLVPYKYMKFIVPAMAPFKFDEFSQNSTEQIVDEVTDPANLMMNINSTNGKYTSAIFMFMGQLGPEVKTYLRMAKENMNFMTWIPTGMSIAITPREHMTLDGKPLQRQAIMLANNSSVRFLFIKLLRDYHLLMDRKAFLTHFQRENIESANLLEKAADKVERIIKFMEIAEKSSSQKETVN